MRYYGTLLSHTELWLRPTVGTGAAVQGRIDSCVSISGSVEP